MTRAALFVTTTTCWVIVSKVQALIIINNVIRRLGLLLSIGLSRLLTVSCAPIGYPYCFFLTLHLSGFLNACVGSSWLQVIIAPASCHGVLLPLQSLMTCILRDLRSAFFFHFVAPSVLVEGSYVLLSPLPHTQVTLLGSEYNEDPVWVVLSM